MRVFGVHLGAPGVCLSRTQFPFVGAPVGGSCRRFGAFDLHLHLHLLYFILVLARSFPLHAP